MPDDTGSTSPRLFADHQIIEPTPARLPALAGTGANVYCVELGSESKGVLWAHPFPRAVGPYATGGRRFRDRAEAAAFQNRVFESTADNIQIV